jgi:pilus assembly protein CpaE
MTKILVIDDEPIYLKLIQRVLDPLGYDLITAENGIKGLQAAKENQPDVIISDLMMPDLSGYEVVSRLRRNPIFAHTPILILTANTDLENKLKAFERGVDDYISKPFNPEEFQARIRVMVQRSEVAKTARTLIGVTDQVESHTIAVHSLRGGSGCSSIALNLSLGLSALWERPTLMIDGVLVAGQIALMLNESSKRTWADLLPDQAGKYDEISIQSVINKHETGLHYIAAPAYPVDAEGVTAVTVSFLLKWVKEHYDYIVIDVSHNFDSLSLAMLGAAAIILLVVSPEMASIRAAAAAINTYERLGYAAEKIFLILNWTFQRQGLPQKQIENALKKKISLVIPYAPDIFIGAINMGKPILPHKFDHPVGVILENAAYQLSQEQQRNYPPIKPTETWKRVSQRLKKIGG